MSLYIRDKKAGVYWYAITIDGVRHRGSLRTTNRATARKLYSVVEAELLLGKYGIKPKHRLMSLGDAFERAYREHWAHTKSKTTVRYNFVTIKDVLGRNTPITSIDGKAIRKLVSHMEADGKSPGTVNRKLALLGKLLRLAHEWGELDQLPVIKLRRESAGRVRTVAERELSAITGWLRSDQTTNDRRAAVADFLECLTDTGCRLSEMLNVDWNDVDMVNGLITLWENKADHPRSQPMTHRVRSILATRKAQHGVGKVFWLLNRDYVDDAWRRAKAAVGIDDPTLVIHCLRHSACSKLVNAGVDLLVVKEFMGHKAIQTTLRYAHLDPNRLRKAASVLEGKSSQASVETNQPCNA